MCGYGQMMGWGLGWAWVWPVLALLGLVALGALAYSLLRAGRGGWGHSTAREILDERYARGEIDFEEYRERGDALR